MTLFKNEIKHIFRRRTYRVKTILTWKGVRKVRLIDKDAVLHDIWEAFCWEFDNQQQYLEKEVAHMREKIEAEKDKNQSDLISSAPGYVFEELRVLFKELEKELDGQLSQLSGGKSRVLTRIQSVLGQDFSGQLRIVDQTEKGSTEQMEKLRRRLERMAKDLQLSEEEVTQLRGELTVAYDGGGVASVYKTVQGLSSDDSNYASKRNLLSKLFESNIEIRKKKT